MVHVYNIRIFLRIFVIVADNHSASLLIHYTVEQGFSIKNHLKKFVIVRYVFCSMSNNILMFCRADRAAQYKKEKEEREQKVQEAKVMKAAAQEADEAQQQQKRM